MRGVLGTILVTDLTLHLSLDSPGNTTSTLLFVFTLCCCIVCIRANIPQCQTKSDKVRNSQKKSDIVRQSQTKPYKVRQTQTKSEKVRESQTKSEIVRKSQT